MKNKASENKHRIVGEFKRTARAVILASGLLLAGCYDPPARQIDPNYIREQAELRQKEKDQEETNTKATLEARLQRKKGVYTEPKEFVNPDGSIDKYFPIEGVVYINRASASYNVNAKNYQIFYRDKKTEKVETFITNNPNNCNFHTQILYDLAPGQEPFLELINLHDAEGLFFWEKDIKVYETYLHLDNSKNFVTIGSYGVSGGHGGRNRVGRSGMYKYGR